MPPERAKGYSLSNPFRAELLDQLRRTFPCGLTRVALQLEAQDRVIDHVPPGQQEVLLLHISDDAQPLLRGPSVQAYGAAGGLVQPGDYVQQRAFAAAAGADDADELAVVGVEVHAAKDLHRPPVPHEELADLLHADLGPCFHAGVHRGRGRAHDSWPQSKKAALSERLQCCGNWTTSLRWNYPDQVLGVDSVPAALSAWLPKLPPGLVFFVHGQCSVAIVACQQRPPAPVAASTPSRSWRGLLNREAHNLFCCSSIGARTMAERPPPDL